MKLDKEYLNLLPDVIFVDSNISKIERSFINNIEKKIQRKLYPGDPLRLIAECFVAEIAQVYEYINVTGKQTLLRYAKNTALDHKAIDYGVYRLPAAKAKTILRFYTEVTYDYIVNVPVGTRVTVDGKVTFATDCHAVINSGNKYVDVNATCLIAGEKGNGFISKQINNLVDPLPYIQRVENITTSYGGSDIESDEDLRLRTQLAPESFSVAGPDLAYVFWVKTAHPNIDDVLVWSPKPGVVEIRFLMKDAKLPSQEIIDDVAKLLNLDLVRPLTDHVIVKAPQPKNVKINLKWWIEESKSSCLEVIKINILEAVKDFIYWQTSKIGRDLNPDKLIQLLISAGAKRVKIDDPIFTKILPTEVVTISKNNINLVYSGVEED